MDPTDFEVIDSVLFDCQNKANPGKYLTPVNGSEVWHEFKKSRNVLPFKYEKLSYDPKEVEEVLKGLEVPEGPLEDVYKRKIEELLIFNEMIAKRDDPKEVRRLSKESFGSPDKELVSIAETILGEPTTEVPKGETAEQVHDAMRKELDKLGLTDWTVVYSPKYITTVTTTEKKIAVCEDKKFGIGDCERLCVHEVNVHVLRSANGAKQPFGIFGLGCPGYKDTEEGLAAYCEELTETGTTIGLRKYAARAMAVHMMETGLSLQDTYEELKQYKAFEGAKAGDVWGICVRVYRSGGFFKDHLYLKGYLDVKRFHEGGGDLSLLWIGKIGLNDLPLVNELITSGDLERPAVVPEWVS
ncbi:MAG: tyrosine/phenylalanine carboxypeptidase domain-containing protein [Candidatus Nanoarchaeia archaeon]